MANLGKVKKNGLASLIKNDICCCRDDAEHPELADKNKVYMYYYSDKDKGIFCGKMKDWQNYKSLQQFVEKRMRERLESCKDVIHRSNIVGAGSLICHVPDDVRPEDVQKFLTGFHKFCDDKFGKNQMLMVAEHHHEHRVHAQAYFMPIVTDKATGQDKLCAKEFFRRELYQSLHTELGQYMDAYMGYHVSIELDEDNPRKRKSQSVNTLKIRSLKKEIRELKKEIKELRKKEQYFANKLSYLEGRLNQIYADYPETRRVRGSRRQPTKDELDKRYKIDTQPIVVEQGTNTRTATHTI